MDKEILIQALVDRINAGMMDLEQVPIPYKEAVEEEIARHQGEEYLQEVLKKKAEILEEDVE